MTPHPIREEAKTMNPTPTQIICKWCKQFPSIGLFAGRNSCKNCAGEITRCGYVKNNKSSIGGK